MPGLVRCNNGVFDIRGLRPCRLSGASSTCVCCATSSGNEDPDADADVCMSLPASSSMLVKGLS